MSKPKKKRPSKRGKRGQLIYSDAKPPAEPVVTVHGGPLKPSPQAVRAIVRLLRGSERRTPDPIREGWAAVRRWGDWVCRQRMLRGK